MDERIYQLLLRLAFFAAPGMTDPPLVKLAQEAEAILREEARRRGKEQVNGAC